MCTTKFSYYFLSFLLLFYFIFVSGITPRGLGWANLWISKNMNLTKQNKTKQNKKERQPNTGFNDGMNLALKSDKTELLLWLTCVIQTMNEAKLSSIFFTPIFQHITNAQFICFMLSHIKLYICVCVQAYIFIVTIWSSESAQIKCTTTTFYFYITLNMTQLLNE